MNRWRILSLGTTDIFLHPATLLYIAYAVLTGHGTFMALSMLSILLHEIAHGAAAAILGQPPRAIELTPLGAVMRMEDDGRLSPFKRAVMLISGPAMTLLLCYMAYTLTMRGLLSAACGRMLFLCNLSILLLNALPALPLDGGRILSLLLERFFSQHIVCRIMQAIGVLLGGSLIVLNLYTSWKLGGWNLSLAFAGCCLLYGAVASTTTYAMAELRQFIDRKIRLEEKGRMRSCLITALHNQTLRQLVRSLPPEQAAIFCCVEPGTMKATGWMTEHEIIQQYLLQPEMTFAQAINMCPNQQKSAKLDTN